MLRPETAGDHVAVGEVVAAAFGRDVEARLVERIRASPYYVHETALVAEFDGAVVGHVMISRAPMVNPAGQRAIAMLSPLAVAPAHQRTGIGAALVRTALAAAGDRREPLVVLEGSPSYYGRLGFEPAARYGIELPLPGWAPPEAAQVMILSAYAPADPALRGTVVYPPAFDGLE